MIVYYDCEIIRCIRPPGVSGDDLPAGIEYCAGFDDFANMGLACCCAIFDDGRLPRSYFSDNIREFQAEIDAAELLVSYNGISFDNPLLLANGVIIPTYKCYDLLLEFKRATGRRVKLDDLARVNLGEAKSGDGANAPLLWQAGKRVEVVTYCLNDVRLLVKLYKLVECNRKLECPYTRTMVALQPAQAALFR